MGKPPYISYACAVGLICCVSAAAGTPILFEAEHFAQKGGWVVDQQFMDQMGSPYVMAHGLGRPVADAVERVEDGRLAGAYRMWVRTRDWVSPQGPGRFTVEIWRQEGTADMRKIFETKPLGVGKGSWHWEDCGNVKIPEGRLEVHLHDLTGFEGRCDAILFAPVEEKSRPNPAWDSWAYRKGLLGLPEHPKKYDFELVVVGGGYAGMCAAVAASRLGVKTALVQDRPVFGGNASSEVRVGPIGKLGLPPFPRNSDLSYELECLSKGSKNTSGGVRPPPDDAAFERWIRAEMNLTAFVFTRAVDVETAVNPDTRIKSVLVRDVLSGEESVLSARLFCDATGDGWLARAAGAEVRVEPETQEETGESLAPRKGAKPNGGYGATNYWLTRWTEAETGFPSCPWALAITDESAAMSEARSGVQGDYPFAAGWNWESGFHLDNMTQGEQIRDHNFRAAYGMWDYLKNKSPDRAKYAKAELSWLAYVLGKRAAGRIIGDYVLCEQDLTQHRVYEDGVVTTTWYLDMHFPHPRNSRHFPGEEFRSFAYDDPNYEREKAPGTVGQYTPIRPYPIPFRCFYSKDVLNLFMAGKDISCTYVAMASVRVEHTTGQMGTMVGRAASLCIKNGWTPRQLGSEHFDLLKTLLADPGPESDLARQGRLMVQNRIGLKNELLYWARYVYHLPGSIPCAIVLIVGCGMCLFWGVARRRSR